MLSSDWFKIDKGILCKSIANDLLISSMFDDVLAHNSILNSAL